MGEANRRGTFEERKAAAIAKTERAAPIQARLLKKGGGILASVLALFGGPAGVVSVEKGPMDPEEVERARHAARGRL